MYKKLEKILMTGYQIWSKYTKKYPILGFFPICEPQRFFSRKPGSITLYPYGAITLCKTRQVYNGPLTSNLSQQQQFFVKNDFLKTKSKKISGNFFLKHLGQNVLKKNKTKYTMERGIYFLMKTNK